MTVKNLEWPVLCYLKQNCTVSRNKTSSPGGSCASWHAPTLIYSDSGPRHAHQASLPAHIYLLCGTTLRVRHTCYAALPADSDAHVTRYFPQRHTCHAALSAESDTHVMRHSRRLRRARDAAHSAKAYLSCVTSQTGTRTPRGPFRRGIPVARHF
jgi:hypothetical protein